MRGTCLRPTPRVPRLRWHGALGLLCALTLALALAHVVAAPPALAQQGVWYYAVERGENPWSITRKYLRDGLRYWRPLIRRNAIEAPREIPPGTIMTIPAGWLRVVPTAAEVVEIEGVATLRRGDAEAVPATEGMALRGGEVLRTAENSTALVRFANGTELLVTQDSAVGFQALTSYANTVMVDATIRLLSGRIETEVGDAGSLDRFEVESPLAVSAVRGTRFRVGAREDADRFEVLTGRVDVAARGRSRRVDAGEGTLARPGEPPAPPRALLPPPGLAPGAQRLERLPLSVRLQPVEGAVAYRVQVSATPAFSSLIVDRVQTAPEVRLGDLADGRYALRARAIDRDGIEGEELDVDVVIDARPPPPFLIAPPPDGKSRTQPPEFRWAEVEGAAGYRFRLEPGLTRGFARDLPPSGRFTLPNELPLGHHEWRIATIAEDGEVGPWSDRQRFEQLEPPPVLDAAALEEGDEETFVRWRDAGEGFRYRVQVARDPHFEDIAVDEVVTENRIAIDAAPGTAIYVRVATVEPDGYEGPFGAVNQIDLPPSPWWPVLLLPLAILLIL